MSNEDIELIGGTLVIPRTATLDQRVRSSREGQSRKPWADPRRDGGMDAYSDLIDWPVTGSSPHPCSPCPRCSGCAGSTLTSPPASTTCADVRPALPRRVRMNVLSHVAGSSTAGDLGGDRPAGPRHPHNESQPIARIGRTRLRQAVALRTAWRRAVDRPAH